MNEQRPETSSGKVDPERDISDKPFDNLNGFFGQEYSREREAADGSRHPSGHPLTGEPIAADEAAAGSSDRDIPADNGRRGSFDGDTGEVRGSGSGGEDEEFDLGTPGGA